MELTYIYHSGFAILANGVTVIIDYFRDSILTEKDKGIVNDELLNRPGKLYVLCSHFHPDHFNKRILGWKQHRPDIICIFSKDILKHKRATEDDAIFIKKGEEYKDDHIRIEAFGSTDIGVSFLINIEGKTIFHAGDLNNWHWSEEATPQEIKKSEGDYLAELKLIKQHYPQIDVVMFPVDPRLGKDYMKGPTQFVEQIKTGIFAPMHFSHDYNGANAFQSIAEANGCRFLTINNTGERWNLS